VHLDAVLALQVGVERVFFCTRALPSSSSSLSSFCCCCCCGTLLQALPSSQHMHNQDTFNAVLEPWQDAAPPYELGPARLRVALFDPLAVPSGCRLGEALRRGVRPILIHANCRTGLLPKVAFLAVNGAWFVRPWDDAGIAAAALCGVVLIAARVAVLMARARREGAGIMSARKEEAEAELEP
jgi:hypothetical protein